MASGIFAGANAMRFLRGLSVDDLLALADGELDPKSKRARLRLLAAIRRRASLPKPLNFRAQPRRPRLGNKRTY
jgi:hypothetical protein